MATYDVYIKQSPDGEVAIRRSKSWNPDDAIGQLRDRGDYIPEAGDRVIRCVEVDDGRSPKSHGGLA